MSPAEGVPPYLRIAGEIRARITSGELRAGDPVPSTRRICQEWDVAKATATKVIDALRRDGLVVAVPRVGTVVAGARRAPRSAGAGLGTARIVAAATGIADDAGLAGLSMRGVAGALGVPTMSLYRHVPGRDELVDLMADAAFGEISYPADPPGWRAGLETAARLHWQVYRRHPWLPSVVSLTHPRLLPHMARYAEWALRQIRELPLAPATGAMVHLLVANYVRGTATNLELQAELDQRTGLSGGGWLRAQRAVDGPAPDDLPELARVAAEDPDFRVDLDELFEFGLRRVLDGVVTLVADGVGADAAAAVRGLR